MAVYHKKYRNMGLTSCDCTFQIDGEGRLHPDPSPEVVAFLSQLANYDIRPEPEPTPAPEPEPAPPKKKPAKRRKKAAKADKEELDNG